MSDLMRRGRFAPPFTLLTGTKPHAPAQIGNWTYTYDANGNVIKKERLVGTIGNSSKNDRKDNGNEKEDKSQGKKDGPTYGSEELNNNKNKVKKDPPGQSGRNDSEIEGGGTSGDYIWNEENRLVEAKVDGNGKSTYFLYDYKGDRTIKRGQGGETLYVNEYYQLQNQNIITKHIFVGSTRIVSKLTHYSNYDSNYEKKNTYTYHPDHLGSSNFVTGPEGNEFEHMEYTPYGESWVDEGTNKNVIGYRFTSKELDTETGLYYFGARYLDPVVSRWISPDPALEEYLPERPVGDEARERNRQLSGMGGVFNPVNLNVYHYAGNNPIIYIDLDGNEDLLIVNNSKPTYDKFESIALIYKDNTLKGSKMQLLKAWGKTKEFFGSSLNEHDVEFFFGKADKMFDNISTLSDDPNKYGTIAENEMLTYEQKAMSWTSKSFLLSSKLGYDKVPQDLKYNKGINPNTKLKYLTEAFMHSARIGDPNATGYTKGSHGCITGRGFTSLYDYLMSQQTGSSGRVIIFR